jgi:hypothetical protein
MGAPDPRKEAVKVTKLSGLTDKARAHWAYQPVKNYRTVAVPKNKNSAWARTPIDNFILDKLEAKACFPSPDADRETLLRRASYDLTGLPPSPCGNRGLRRRPRANAWEKVIDRLLASKHYGERWGRHWLDTARYADTVGGDANTNNGRTDYRYAHAWTYRDYVIRAFNEDKPYDKFITDQLAADLIYSMKPAGSVSKNNPPAGGKPSASTKPDNSDLVVKAAATPAQTAKATPAVLTPNGAPAKPAKPAKPDAPAMMGGDNMMMMGGGGSTERGTGIEMEADANLAALGFLTVGERFNNNNDIINDRIDVVGRGLLGLTVACARCHDHMFDPVSQKDYYALHGVFSSYQRAGGETAHRCVRSESPRRLRSEEDRDRERESRHLLPRSRSLAQPLPVEAARVFQGRACCAKASPRKRSSNARS